MTNTKRQKKENNRCSAIELHISLNFNSLFELHSFPYSNSVDIITEYTKQTTTIKRNTLYIHTT